MSWERLFETVSRLSERTRTGSSVDSGAVRQLRRGGVDAAVVEPGQAGQSIGDGEQTEEQTSYLREDLNRGFDDPVDEGAVLHADDDLGAFGIDGMEQEDETNLEVPGEHTDHHVHPIPWKLTDENRVTPTPLFSCSMKSFWSQRPLATGRTIYSSAGGIGIDVGDVERSSNLDFEVNLTLDHPNDRAKRDHTIGTAATGRAVVPLGEMLGFEHQLPESLFLDQALTDVGLIPELRPGLLTAVKRSP